MSEWNKARVCRIEKKSDGELVYFEVAGHEAETLSKHSSALKRANIHAKVGDELEFTFKKGELKIDQLRNPAAIPKSTSPAQVSGPPLGIHLPANNPYTFLPINLAATVKAAPVWHDGSPAEESTFSGEIRCTLTARTPLLVGNQRFKVEQADGLPSPRPDADKGILEPLRLADGRVLLPGSSLKGMLRNSLAALLNAPMERVKEHHYSYRPNLDFNKHEREKYCTRPAIVLGQKNGLWQVQVLPTARSANFKQHEKPADARTYSYRGGIDGSGHLAKAHAESNKRPGGVYKAAYVSAEVVNSSRDIILDIPATVFKAYEQTQKILANNTDGHLTGHPLASFLSKDTASSIAAATPIAVNQLIYVEVELKNNKPDKIVSMGHHFRYRWAYRDSIRYIDALHPKEKTLRPELDVDAQEQNGQLTAANLLFGYAGSKRQFGGTAVDKLAGRIAINHAISQPDPQFLNPDKGHWVFLNILGQPKASAVEHYLLQPDGKHLMHTYGDLPDTEGGKLAGRKFYRHQPAAASDASCYETDDREVRQKNQATLARFISVTGSTFKFTLRFARLRAWELGALIAALNPHRLDAGKQQLDDYALKLGYGKPLGLGSVRIEIDDLRLFDQSAPATEQQIADWTKALDSRLTATAPKKAWLQVHRWQGSRLAYPGKGSGSERIYTHHTDIRKKYSKLRRQAHPAESDNQNLNDMISGKASK